MRSLVLFILLAIGSASCKEDFHCKCYSDRRGFIVEQYSHTYKERNKGIALSKCKTDYENSSDYVNGGYCEIK